MARNKDTVKPFLKWVGGKRQLLDILVEEIPAYNTYIEPFVGGGALFFHLRPQRAILSDANPELINCYEVVRDNLEGMLSQLSQLRVDKDSYYAIRAINPNQLGPEERAARFYYLNKTCFNGLYRVNKQGAFNVPYGQNNLKQLIDFENLTRASEALQNVKLICDDYKAVTRRYAVEGDLVFFDPPYVPVSEYSDFNRYTKEFFYDEDQIELRNEFERLINIGVKVILTNSNTPFVSELYKAHEIKIFETKRTINSVASKRVGQDVVISNVDGKRLIDVHQELLSNFPGTRYMGSKYKLLPNLWNVIKGLNFHSALDAFSGSGCVSYMFKQKGIETYSNDFMNFSSTICKAVVENSTVLLEEKDIERLFEPNPKASKFISTTFKDIYFSEEDNLLLDIIASNIPKLENEYKQALAMSAIIRACMKKRPRGIFTYVGQRYDDGRRDLHLTMKEHFLDNVESFNAAVFNNGQNNKSFNSDVFSLDVKADLVYFDPPYLTSKSDNDYTRRYHFVEGLSKNWEGLSIDYSTKTRKFKKYESPFDSKRTVNGALERLFDLHRKSILVVSYSSNSIPTKEEMLSILKNFKSTVEITEVDYTYSFANQGHKKGNISNRVQEYIFTAF